MPVYLAEGVHLLEVHIFKARPLPQYPVIFNLLPDKFSLRELQDLYQSILGQELDRRNFRKRINLKNWLVDLNEMEEDVPHRPGKLYKLKTGLKKNSLESSRNRFAKVSI